MIHPVHPKLGTFWENDISRLHRAHVEHSLDCLEADVESYKWTVVADKESYGTWDGEWGGRNSELMGWKFEGCRGESRARVQYWRFQKDGDMIIIETEDHIWMLRSRWGEGEILSDFVSFTRYDLDDEDTCIHKVPDTLTVEALTTVNRFMSLQMIYRRNN